MSKKLIILIAVLALAALFAAGGFTFAASQEQHDSFCASCHTQPESTFYGRTTSAPPADLASFHTGQKTRCIDCHSGQGTTGRISAEMMGARNALKWYTGTAIQPAVLTYAIGDQNCLKCHQAITQRGFTPQEQITVPGLRSGEGEGEGRNNHWHQFMARWQAASPTAGTCVNCHWGHAPSGQASAAQPPTGTAQEGFMNAQAVQDTCNACHQVLRRGRE